MKKQPVKKSAGKNRSAVTGEYVKPSFARKHPKTTVKESAKLITQKEFEKIRTQAVVDWLTVALKVYTAQLNKLK